MPLPSHITLGAPRYSRKTASRSARPRAGRASAGFRPARGDEDGAEVPGPAAIGGKAKDLDPLLVHADPLQEAPGPRFMGAVPGDDAHLLPRRELADDLAVRPRDRGEAARPVGLRAGPADPGRLVGLPLGRHAEPRGVYWQRLRAERD